MATKVIRPYTFGEEVCNCLTHSLGAALGIAMVAILTAFSALYGDAWGVVSSAIFGATVIFMYSASSIYHAIQSEKLKKRLKKLDHIAIYYLIAGSYTPFLLVSIRGALGWTMFGIIWGLAILGTILKLTLSGNGTKVWSISLYLGMGWLVVFASKYLFAALNTTSIVFLVAGGIAYTLGILFYIWKSKAYTHAVWHCFVLAGTILQFFSILWIFVP